MKKVCFHCARLGKCEDATEEMLKNKKGCGSWFAAHPKEVEARLGAVKIAGIRALHAMLTTHPLND